MGELELPNPVPKPVVRTFESGASRDTSAGKFDYLGFMHPVCDHSFASYMHEHRKMADGSLRDADNWWAGFGKDVTIQSMVRHVEDLKALHSGFKVYEIRHSDGDIEKQYIKKDCTPEVDSDAIVLEITIEDCCNAIRFATQAYLIEELDCKTKK